MFDTEVLKPFTKAQLVLLLHVYDECKLQGADSKMLAPLGAVIWIDWDYKPTEADMSRGKEFQAMLDAREAKT